jgi:hypothetical protein
VAPQVTTGLQYISSLLLAPIWCVLLHLMSCRFFKMLLPRRWEQNSPTRCHYWWNIPFHSSDKFRWVMIRGCIQKFQDWKPGARTANVTALCLYVQLYHCFVSQSSEFFCHNPLCYFSTSNTKGKHTFHYQLSLETFGYTLIIRKSLRITGQLASYNIPHSALRSWNTTTICMYWDFFTMKIIHTTQWIQIKAVSEYLSNS